MRRVTMAPRRAWQRTVEGQGLTFHSRTAPYWQEDAAYAFSAKEIDELELAANRVHELYLEAAQRVIDRGEYDRLRIPPHAAELVERSWNNDELHLYGRFDFMYDGTGAPKLLEYNADTPTSLLEASAIQWYWLKDRLPHADQFNSIHEALVSRWSDLRVRSPMHFAAVEDNEEDVMTVEYLRDTASQAGLQTRHIPVERIGHDGTRFVGEEGERIDTLFKLYPWEWMVHEGFGKHLASSGTRFIEPPWKMLWSNKAMLPVLYEMAPNHPNLLPAYFDQGRILGDWVRKPIYSREGANVTISRGGSLTQTDGDYGEDGHVYQQFAQHRSFDGKHPVLGLWMIGDECRGMGIRESESHVTDNLSRFTPHYFE